MYNELVHIGILVTQGSDKYLAQGKVETKLVSIKGLLSLILIFI